MRGIWGGLSSLRVRIPQRAKSNPNAQPRSPSSALSELYYSWSNDGGITWASTRPIRTAFDPSLGYPQQNKMGDYIGMVSLNEGACIAYTATFNGEEDIYFVRAELPIIASARRISNVARISWNAVPGISYCVQAEASLALAWSAATNVACVVASGNTASVDDPLGGSGATRFYRVVRQP